MNKRMFQILDEMNVSDVDNNTATVGICNQLVEAKTAKGGGHVTIGVPAAVVTGLLFDKNKIPILLIIDKAEYERVEKIEMPDDSADELCEEGKALVVKLLPPAAFGEHDDVERLYNIFDELNLIIGGVTEGADQWKAEYDTCREILQHLVTLKQVKDTQGKDDEYMKRQPLAWEKAKRFLEKYQHQ
jgi:hypothetical protein